MGDMREKLVQDAFDRISNWCADVDQEGDERALAGRIVDSMLVILREPTGTMVEAGCESVTGYARPTAIRTAYTAMIDAIRTPAIAAAARSDETRNGAQP